MTVYVHRFMVVPAANVVVARGVAQTLANATSPGSAAGVWQVGCNASGTGTPTHYVSSGVLDANFAALLGNASATFSQYQLAGGTTYTLADIQALYTATPVGTFIRSDSQGKEEAALTALGLKIIRGTL